MTKIYNNTGLPISNYSEGGQDNQKDIDTKTSKIKEDPEGNTFLSQQ